MNNESSATRSFNGDLHFTAVPMTHLALNAGGTILSVIGLGGCLSAQLKLSTDFHRLSLLRK